MSSQNMMNKVATPYAEALLEIAQNYNLLSKTTEDLSKISNILSDSSDLQQSLSNPSISILIKKNILIALFKNEVNDFILNFLLVLVDRRRILLLSKIIDIYLELAYNIESTVIVELYTPVEFNEIQVNALIEKIKIMTQSKSVKLVTTLDINLIGGFIIKIGSKVIDTSLAGKLQQISFYLNKS